MKEFGRNSQEKEEEGRVGRYEVGEGVSVKTAPD